MYYAKYSKECVEKAIKRVANKLKREKLIHEDTVFLVMLNGGVWFASHLFDQLGNLANEVYYLKGHSYDAQRRDVFTWDYLPPMDLKGKNIILLDDVCDSGATIQAVYDQFGKEAKSMMTVTLLKRIPCPLPESMAVYSCIEDDTKQFFVGCGLDDNNKSRLISYVGVVK